MHGYVFTPEENELYTDEMTMLRLEELGLLDYSWHVIPRIRGEKSWYEEDFYE